MFKIGITIILVFAPTNHLTKRSHCFQVVLCVVYSFANKVTYQNPIGYVKEGINAVKKVITLLGEPNVMNNYQPFKNNFAPFLHKKYNRLGRFTPAKSHNRRQHNQLYLIATDDPENFLEDVPTGDAEVYDENEWVVPTESTRKRETVYCKGNNTPEFLMDPIYLNNSEEVDKKARQLFSYTWEPQYAEFYKWYYRIIADDVRRPERLQAWSTFKTPIWEDFMASTPFPVPPQKVQYWVYISQLFKAMDKQKQEAAGSTPS